MRCQNRCERYPPKLVVRGRLIASRFYRLNEFWEAVRFLDKASLIGNGGVAVSEQYYDAVMRLGGPRLTLAVARD